MKSTPHSSAVLAKIDPPVPNPSTNVNKKSKKIYVTSKHNGSQQKDEAGQQIFTGSVRLKRLAITLLFAEKL